MWRLLRRGPVPGAHRTPAAQPRLPDQRRHLHRAPEGPIRLPPPSPSTLRSVPRAGRAPPPRTGYALITPPPRIFARRYPRWLRCVRTATSASRFKPKRVPDRSPTPLATDPAAPTRALRSTPSLLRPTTRTRPAKQKMAVVADLCHPHRPRGRLPLPEIGTRTAAHLPPQTHPSRRTSVHHRHRLPARTAHPTASARSRRARELEHRSTDPRRTTAHHRHLPTRRWAHFACTQSHPRRTAPAGHLRRPGHRPRTRSDPQDHRVKSPPACKCSATRPL